MAEGGEETDHVKDIIAGSDSGCEFPCQPCCVEGPIIESSGFCVTCDEYLCSDCYKHHKKSKLSRNHVILDKDAMPKDSSEKRTIDVCTEPCQTHTGKVIEYYCPAHDDFGCSVCMTMGHRHCDDYQYIPDVARDLNLDENDEFKNLKESAESIHSKATISEKEIEKSRNVASEKLKTFQNIKQKVFERFESAERKLTKELNDITTEGASKVSDLLNQYESALSKIETMIDEGKLLYTHKQMCRLFIQLKRANQEKATIANDLEKSEKDAACAEYEVVVDKHVRSVLKNTDSLGKVKMTPDGATTEVVQEYTVRLADDASQCWITGLTLVSAHLLVAVDRANSKVKLVDLGQNKITSVYKLENYGAARDVVKISDNQIAIACESGNIVALDIDETPLIRYNRTIRVNGSCRGITRANDILIVSFIDNGRLDFITLDGDIVKTVSMDEKGKKLFRFPYYVFYDSIRDVIIVTNTGDSGSPNSVTSLSPNGTVNSVHTYTRSKGSVGYTGVETDLYGTLYICCWRSHEVHMLSSTFSRDRILLQNQNGVHQPYAICLNEDLHEFYVGMRGVDKITAYSLPL